jgi:hypothetical protein
MCKPVDRRVRVSCCTSLTLGLRPMTALRQKRSFIDNHHLLSNYFRTCDQGVESPLDDGNESSDDFRCAPDSGHRRPARPCPKSANTGSRVLYSTTLSAVARRVGGTASPSALAAFRLIDSSNLET